MEGQAVYAELKQATDNLVKYSNELDDPIDTYMQNSNKIGADGSAWGGTAAEKAAPILAAIKADIIQLQKACMTFSEKVDASLVAYQQTDVSANKTISDVKQGQN